MCPYLCDHGQYPATYCGLLVRRWNEKQGSLQDIADLFFRRGGLIAVCICFK